MAFDESNRNVGRSRKAFWTYLKNENHLRLIVRLFLKKEGLSIRAISEKINVNPAQMSNYLNNKGNPNLSDLQIISLCDTLGLKLEIKITFKEDESD